MKIDCNDRERIFLDGTPEEWAALEAHSGHCAACREELAGWRNLSLAASSLREEWESPALWPRIERALRERSAEARPSWWAGLRGSWNLRSFTWQTAAAALLLALVSSAAVWVILHPGPDFNGTLLKDPVVRNIERKQADYEEAIDKLDAEARPELDKASTPLMAGYREKLQVLDGAIADLKAQAGINPANGHLRRQLLAMYQEKQLTLEEVLEAKQP
jgi:hypothetical protein